TRLQALILGAIGSLLYLFNSCDGKFEAAKYASSSQLSCQAKVTPLNFTSPFIDGKVALDDEAATKYLAIIDNNCLRSAPENALSRNLAADATLEDDWNQQPHALPLSTEDLRRLNATIEADNCIVG